MLRRTETIVLGALLWLAVAGALGGASVALAPGKGGAGGAGGAGGHSETSAGGSGGAETRVLHEGSTAPTEIVVDEAHLYWLETPYQGLGALETVDKDGGGYRRLAELKTPSELILAGDFLVMSSTDGSKSDLVRVNKVGKTSLQVIARGADACGVAAFEGSIYWTDAQGRLRRVRAEGGAPATLVQKLDRPCSLVVDENGLFWVNKGTGEEGASTIMHANLDGTEAKPLAAHEYGPLILRADATHVFWSTLDGQIKSAPKNGDGDVKTLYTTHHALVIGMAEDGDNLYWSGAGGVWSQPKDGGDPTAVLSQLRASRGVAVDATEVFAVDMGSGEAADGRILAIRRP